jgi:hypothetical protein
VPRLSKGQRRLNAIFEAIPRAREQLLVAVEDFDPDFDLDAFLLAAGSPDAHEVLLNWLHELAARSLAEGQRLGVVEKASGHPWERLAALGVISQGSATRLQEAKELRDDLAHAYPPAGWRALHEGVQILLEELDRYVDRCAAWLTDEGILEMEQ